MTLVNFLKVVGSGTILKIGFEDRIGFDFEGRTIHLYDKKEIRYLYGHRISNIYILEGGLDEEVKLAVILE